MKTVSVIIPNYNYGRFLREAIDSVLGQTHPPHEVIVIDDGSTDESREILESYGDRVRVHFQKNEGVGAARNKGAEMATGEILAFLDADDYWAPSKTEKQLVELEAKPDVGLVHCGLYFVDVNGSLGDTYLDGGEGEVREKLLRFETVISGPGGTSMIPRSIFLEVGGYDTNKDLHPSEDWELSYRIATRYKFAFVPEPLLFYRQHGSGGHMNIPRMERAMLIAYGKAFADGDETVQRIRKECYGNFYMVLAGSYLHSGNILKSISSGVRSLLYHPAKITRLLGFPFRVAKRVLRPGSGNTDRSHSF